VPADDSWLGPRELATLAHMLFARRRVDWRLGRWTAKRAASAYLGLPPASETLRALEIRPAPSGAPELFWANRPAAITISLSHRSGIAVCAVSSACDPAVALGCDLERVEQHSELFLADYFTVEEQSLVRQASAADRWRLLALLWSAKESLLKALRLGLRADTRSVNVTLELPPAGGSTAWHTLRVHYADIGTLGGWWYESAGFIRTLVVLPLLSSRIKDLPLHWEGSPWPGGVARAARRFGGCSGETSSERRS
jgi:4'-phosphopantetheinyl transferase